MNDCPSCGAPLEPDARFCGACGRETPPTPSAAPVCAACGQELEPGSQFCGSCGALVPGVPALTPAVNPDARESARIEPAVLGAAASTSRGGAGSGRGPLRWLLIVAGVVVIIAAVALGVAYTAGWVRGAAVRSTASTISTPAPPPAVAPLPSSSSGTDGGGGASPAPVGGDDEMVAFLQEVETTMSLAGDGRHGIAAATTGYAAGDMTANEAAALIQSVIDNRKQVLATLAAMEPPGDAAARDCHTAFQRAMTFSVRADESYLEWVYGAGTLAAAGPDNEKAGRWKRVFLRRYNALARAYGLPHDWSLEDI